MDWIQVLTIIGSTLGACWFFRRETKEQLTEMRTDMKEFQKSQIEFHGRLCTLEERYLQMMQRHLEKKDKK